MEKQLPKIFNLDCIQVASVEGDIVIYGVPVNFNESSSSKPLEPLLENLKATRSRIKFVGYG